MEQNFLNKEIKINKSIIFKFSIICIIILLIFLISFYTELYVKMGITFKVITGQINIDNEIAENEKLLGLTDVEGEGIIININDGNDLIHQEDVLIVIDELKNAGSHAISINNVRIVGNTYILCDGGVILVDGQKISNPFSIKAIGNKEILYSTLTRNKGYVKTLLDDEIEISIEKNDNLKIGKSTKKEFEKYLNETRKIEKLFESNRMVGKTNYKGTGFEIIITENKSKLSAISFLQIINDLNSAGAKAISINDNRITAMTDCVDISKKYTLINSNYIKSPYMIKVIGDKDKIFEKINADNSYFAKIREYKDSIYIYETYTNIEKYENKNDQNKLE